MECIGISKVRQDDAWPWVRGAVINVSLRQKINTKSTCETELVGVNNCISSVLWLLYFVQAQGHDAKWARIYQDNQSAILLEKNGRILSEQED